MGKDKNQVVESQQLLDADAAYERAKTKTAKAKHKLKTADKNNLTKAQLELLRLKLAKAKAKQKAKKAALKIVKLQARLSVSSVESKNSEAKTAATIEAATVVVVAEEAPKKRGRKAKEEAAPAVEAASVERKRRGPRPMTEEEKAVARAARAADPNAKPRGRRPKAVEEAERALVAPEDEPDAKAGTSLSEEPESRAVEEPAKPAKRARRSSEEVKALREAATAELKGDDFRVIEGIGLRATQILHDAGVLAFQDLAESSVDDLTRHMRAARFNLAQPASWPQQAQLVVEGKTEELEALKATLKRGV